ncbi:MAG: hypothetical protein JWP25_1583 [Bradyrhizobium sp.]|nr:hypothetical protein [Bradyrhizobium sp.]
MAENKVIDIGKLIDDQPIRPFHIKIVIIVFLVMLSDGYDLQSIGFAAPGIVKTLNMDRTMMGPVLSASLVGMLFGAPLFGWIGDRFGRRLAILAGVFIYGTVTLVAAAANSLPELLVLRFLTGVGLGAVPANSVALIAEYAPKRVRATMIVSAQLGLTFGSMLPALASGMLEADYGWRSLFVVGGLAPLVIGVLLIFALPESLKYMVVSKKSPNRLMRVAKALDPRLQSQTGLTFVFPEGEIAGAQRFHIKQLFAAGLTWITPLIWGIYITFLTANYFLHGWMPLLFRDEGLSIGQTAVAAAMFDAGGVIGALIASRLVDTFGVAAIVTLYMLACPAVAIIGMVGNSVYLVSAAVFLAGFCMIGITLSMGAVTGIIYPTEMRAKGIGWAYGIGRFCSMLAPVVGGWLIAMKLPISQLFLAPAVPLVVGAVLCFALMRLCVKRFNGYSLTNTVAADHGVPSGELIATASPMRR